MIEISLRNRILKYLIEWYEINPEHFINGGEIERLALDAGYKSSNASRRLREMAEEGKLERRENEKGHVIYRYNPPTI